MEVFYISPNTKSWDSSKLFVRSFVRMRGRVRMKGM